MLGFTLAARYVDAAPCAPVVIVDNGAYRATISQIRKRGAMGAYLVVSTLRGSRYRRAFDTLASAYESIAREYRDYRKVTR